MKPYAITAGWQQKWQVAATLGGVNWSSPAIGADGTIYLGANDAKLHAINGQPGILQFDLTGYTVNENGGQAIRGCDCHVQCPGQQNPVGLFGFAIKYRKG